MIYSCGIFRSILGFLSQTGQNFNVIMSTMTNKISLFISLRDFVPVGLLCGIIFMNSAFNPISYEGVQSLPLAQKFCNSSNSAEFWGIGAS